MQGLSYFQAKTSSKRKPSTLLETPEFRKKLAQGTQLDTLKGLSLKNAARVQNLHLSVSDNFPDWRYKLRLGFSLLFYGYGSKKAILDRFGGEACRDGGVLVVNGWAHHLTLRGLLLKVVATLRKSGVQTSTRASGDARSLLQTIRDSIGEQRLYIIIHGIDAPETHSILGGLAALEGVHLVASVDHVNAPLLWDKGTAAHFNWIYEELTTFMPYCVETARIQPLLTSDRGDGERQGASVVLQTLVPNARQIFKSLAEHQLDASDESGGMPLHELFKACRERFLVTNELALRSHLNEFRDHQLVQTRRSPDGAEVLHIPMAASMLEQILADLE